jgi:hypothetical protein
MKHPMNSQLQLAYGIVTRRTASNQEGILLRNVELAVGTSRRARRARRTHAA